jgi:pilus assembly protein CpaF
MDSHDLAQAVHRHLLLHDADDLRAEADAHTRRLAPLLPAGGRAALVDDVLARVHGLGPLDALLADPDVTDVLVNRGTDVWVERRGVLGRAGHLPPGVVDAAVERVLAPLGLRLDRVSPVVDARLADGSRLNAVVPPVAVDGTTVAIRRFTVHTVPLDAMAAPGVTDLLHELVQRRANLVVSGATSAGKTTLLGALAAEIPPGERVITIEDAAELRLATPHVVRLEARPPGPEGGPGVTVRDLVRAALRLRPDRIVVGEVRGAEALDMVQAMNTGHDGSLTTCHANGPADALRRIEAMVLQGGPALPLPAVREQVHSSIDAVVHVVRGTEGRREVAAVAEVLDDPLDPARVRLVTSGGGIVARPTRWRCP